MKQPAGRETEDSRAGRPGYRQVLRTRNVARLITSAFFSRLAAEMVTLSLVLYSFQRFGSASLAGAVAFLAFAPGFVVSPVAGAFLDRFGSVVAVAVDLTLSTVLIGVLALASPLGFLSPSLLLAVAFLYSLTSPLGMAGVRTLLPRLVPPDALDRANALDTSAFSMAEVLGPLAAGALVGLAGGSAALAVVSALYLVSVLVLVPLLRTRFEYGPAGASSSIVREALRGIGYVVRQRVLRGLALSYSLYMVSWGIFVVLTPALLAREFPGGNSEALTGMIWAAMGTAGMVGALVAGRVRVSGRERLIIGVGMAVLAVAFTPGIAGAGTVALCVALLALGASGGPIDVSVLTLRQRGTDPSRLGRVLAVSTSVNMSGLPIGTAVGGFLVSRSMELAFTVASVTMLLAAAFGYFLLARD
ncbi:MFS transporter [Streptosporangium saharense]|uniref:MFS transporter n=1 Tax=Streptosporangium saharense TaxID=1706840 RepID=UPI003326355E